MYTEFVVIGQPASNQSSKQILVKWKAAVAAAAVAEFADRLPLAGPLKAVMIHFYTRDTPRVDLDNLSKPLFDALQGVVYADDRQIEQLELVLDRTSS